MKAIFIKDIGLVVVSRLMDYDGKKSKNTFKIEMFDLNLNIKWSENLDVNRIISLKCSNSKEKIALVAEKERSKITFWDFNGLKTIPDYNINSKLMSITSNDENIFFLEHKGENRVITKIDFSGKKLNEIYVSEKEKIIEENINELIYKEDQLFLLTINNSIKNLIINKIF